MSNNIGWSWNWQEALQEIHNLAWTTKILLHAENRSMRALIHEHASDQSITPRTLLAGLAMAGILGTEGLGGNIFIKWSPGIYEATARHSVKYADAVLAELEAEDEQSSST